MKRFKLRLYRRRDMDLIAIKQDPRIDFKGLVKTALADCVRNGQCARFVLPPQVIPVYAKDETVVVPLDDDMQDVIDWLCSLRKGEGGNAIKCVLRSAIQNPRISVFETAGEIIDCPVEQKQRNPNPQQVDIAEPQFKAPVVFDVPSVSDTNSADADENDDEFSWSSMMDGQEF